MQVSCSRDQLFKTIAIHWEIEDEFLKDTRSYWMIYFYKSHSDAVLYWFLQFLSLLYKELLKDCLINDSTHSKKDDIWMKSCLSNDFWSYEEINDQSIYSSSFWSE